MNHSDIEKTTATETILTNLKPLIQKMLTESPDYGTIEISLHFINGLIKRFETQINRSVQFNG